MTKWTTTLLALVVLVAVSVNASPITDGATNKVMARQDGTAPSAEVVTSSPVAPVPAAPAEEEEDDDDDDDDDYDITGGLDDDDDDDDETEDDDDDDDDDYLERFFDDILADDDDDDDDETPAKPPTPVSLAEVTSAPAVTPEITGNTVSTAVSSDEDDYDEDDADEDDEDQDEAASETQQEQQRPALGEDETDDDEEEEDDEAAEKDEGSDEEEGDDDDDNDVTNDDDDDEEDLEDLDSDEDDDETDIVSAKSARALGAKAPKMPAAHLTKYNRFVDSIIGRINEVLKKSFDPVTVRLTRGSPPPSRRPVNDPKHNAKVGDEGPTYELVAVSRNEELPIGRSATDNVASESTPTTGHKHHGRRNKNKGNKGNKQNNRQRARATLIGLASLRRDGDVTVNSMTEHTTVRSRFLLGPLVLRVEKQFGRGAKKELRSATATTDKMTGRMILRVNPEGVAKLHSIRVLQPKQVRVESDDDHDRTREFVWRRSSHIAGLVSQKLSKAARDLLQTKEEVPNSSTL